MKLTPEEKMEMKKEFERLKTTGKTVGLPEREYSAYEAYNTVMMYHYIFISAVVAFGIMGVRAVLRGTPVFSIIAFILFVGAAINCAYTIKLNSKAWNNYWNDVVKKKK